MNLVPDRIDDSLLGADFASVRERFGAPLRCRQIGGELLFAYRLRDGQVCDHAVVVSDGVVTRVHASLSVTNRDSDREGLVGCSVEQLLSRFGNPDSALTLRDAMELRFDDVVLLVADGLVVAVSKRHNAAS